MGLGEDRTAMRRKDKEITDKSDIEAIIAKARICRMGIVDGNRPYIVPLCFGYQDNTFYFHSASDGKKIELLRSNNRVCFELDVDCKVVGGDTACDWGMHYKSVIGFGRAEFVEDPVEKKQALDIIMRQYAGMEGSFEYKDSALRNTVVLQVRVVEMTAKQSG